MDYNDLSLLNTESRAERIKVEVLIRNQFSEKKKKLLKKSCQSTLNYNQEKSPFANKLKDVIFQKLN